MNVEQKKVKKTEMFLSNYKGILTSMLGHEPEGWDVFKEEYIDLSLLIHIPDAEQNSKIHDGLYRQCIIYEEFLGLI